MSSKRVFVGAVLAAVSLVSLGAATALAFDSHIVFYNTQANLSATSAVDFYDAYSAGIVKNADLSVINAKLNQAFNLDPIGGVGGWDGGVNTDSHGDIIWLGQGIGSTMADRIMYTVGDFYGLGVMSGDQFSTSGAYVDLYNPAYYSKFWGETINPTDVILNYTLRGDINLDGVLNGDDYFYMNYNWGQTNSLLMFDSYGITTPVTWADGDVNHDGIVNGDDYFYLNYYWGQSIPQSPLSYASGGAAASSMTATPEPSTLVLLVGAALGGFFLWRRKHA